MRQRPFKAVQTLHRGTPHRQLLVVVHQPAQRPLHGGKRHGGRDQHPHFDLAAEVARRQQQIGEHHGRHHVEGGKPDQVLLLVDQRTGGVQQRVKARAQLGTLNALAAIKGNRLGVVAHAHQVVAKVGLQALLVEVELALRPANDEGDPGAQAAVQQRNPDHEARNVQRRTTQRLGQRDVRALRDTPQHAGEQAQRQQRAQQPRGQHQRHLGKDIDVFLNTLIRVVRHLHSGGVARQLQPVKRLLPQPALQVVLRQPAAPAQLQHLHDVKQHHRRHNDGAPQQRKPAQQAPEAVGIALLQRRGQGAGPFRVGACQRRGGDGQHRHQHQHAQRPPALVRAQIRQHQTPCLLQRLPCRLDFPHVNAPW